MVSATQQQQQQQLQSQPVTAPLSVEEEALKRNTDCVYFLASPLTCKKGSECEYRHSEYARVNPRDCWFWLNGNCLNPKCSYRHPPLDALIGTQVPTPSGSSLVPPTTAAAAVAAPHVPYTSGKQAVPCIFFQKGYCSKGDKCSFSHGSNPIASKTPVPPPVAPPVTEAQPPKKVFGVLQKCTQEQKIPQPNISKQVQPPFIEAKPAAKIEAVPPKNGIGLGKRAQLPIDSDDEIPRYEPTNVLPLPNGNSLGRSHRIHQTHVLDDHGLQNDRDGDDYLRESSPGFDVLVDDDVNESDYYHNEGMNLNSMNEYESLADVNPEVFRESRGYDSYERFQGGQYGWEQRRASSERVVTGASHVERRVYKDRSPDEIFESDLRHRLSKQRKGSGNGLRSVINSDYDRDRRVDGRSHRSSHSRRDSDRDRGRDRDHRSPPQESSVSSRLWGRIKLPERSGVVDCGEVRKDRHWGRVSPAKPQVSSHQGRLRDRIKGKTPEDFGDEGRNHLRNGDPRVRREFMDERNTDFSGPKSLAELKGGKQRNHRVEDYQPSEGDVSFEGPKPLSVILKRKRGAGGSSNEESDDMSSKTRTEQKPRSPVLGSKVETEEEEEEEEEEGLVETKKHKSSHGETSHELGELENEEGMIVEEGIEDENRDDGEYDYEHEEGTEFNGDEEGNDYNNVDEEEYPDDDDEDEFAKKMGVMFS